MDSSTNGPRAQTTLFISLLFIGMLAAASVELQFEKPSGPAGSAQYRFEGKPFTLEDITILEKRPPIAPPMQTEYRFAKNSYYSRYEGEIKKAIEDGIALPKKFVIAQTDTASQGVKEVLVIVRINQDGTTISLQKTNPNQEKVSLRFPSDFKERSEKIYPDVRLPTDVLDYQNLVPGKGRKQTQRVRIGWHYTYQEQPKIAITAEKILYDRDAFKELKGSATEKTYNVKTVPDPKRSVNPDKIDSISWDAKDAASQKYVESGDYAIHLKTTRAAKAGEPSRTDDDKAWPLHVAANPLAASQFLIDVSKSTPSKPVTFRFGNYEFQFKGVAQGGRIIKTSIKDDFGTRFELTNVGLKVGDAEDLVADGTTTYPDQEFRYGKKDKKLIPKDIGRQLAIQFILSRPTQLPQSVQSDEMDARIRRGDFVVLTIKQDAWLDVGVPEGFTDKPTTVERKDSTDLSESLVQTGSFQAYLAKDFPQARQFPGIKANTLLAAFTLNEGVDLKKEGTLQVQFYDDRYQSGRIPLTTETLTAKTQTQSGRTYVYTINANPQTGTHKITLNLLRMKDNHREEYTGSVAVGKASPSTPTRPETETQGFKTLKGAKLMPATQPYYVSIELHRAANIEVKIKPVQGLERTAFNGPVGTDNVLTKYVRFGAYLQNGDRVTIKAIPLYQTPDTKKEETLTLVAKGASVAQPPQPSTEKTGPIFPRQAVTGSCFGDVQARTVTYDVNGRWMQLYVDYRVGNCYTACGNDGRYDAVTDMKVTLENQGATLASLLNDPSAKATLASVSENPPHTTCKYLEEDGKPLQCCALRGAARQGTYWVKPNAGRSNGQNTPLKWP